VLLLLPSSPSVSHYWLILSLMTFYKVINFMIYSELIPFLLIFLFCIMYLLRLDYGSRNIIVLLDFIVSFL